jgi:hypothetical protein
MARKKLPERPAAPSEPRSFLLPVSALLALLFVAVAYPALSAAEEEEPEQDEAASDEPELATLTVRTVPEGATVTAGDEECTAPCDLELPADEELTLRVTKEGFKAVEQAVTPEAGMEPMDLELEAAPFVLSVAAPEGATVTVNGEAVSDPSAIELGESLEGPVAIEVSQRGFRPFHAEVGADAFESEDERRFHQLEVGELERRGRRAPRPSPATMAAPEEEAEPEGPLPNNPFG